MKNLDRLVKLACYYNRIKDIEFYREYDNKRIVDARSMVYYMALNTLKYSLYDVCDFFNKEEGYILELIEHHKSEYEIINHYTQMYDNIETQFLKWRDSELDLQYCIIKTKYDSDIEKKYEYIVNENSTLKNELEKLNYKSKNKYYV